MYVSVFSIVDQLFLWTLGVKLTAPEGEGKFDLKKLVNPASIGIIVALFMILTGLKLPTLLNTGLQKIGSTATPLAMIYLGGIFACVPMKNGLRRGELYGIVFAKSAACPYDHVWYDGSFWNSRGCKTDDRTDRRNACYGIYSDDGNAL